MRHFIVSAVLLAGALALAPSAFADSAPDRVQATSTFSEQSAQPASAWSTPSGQTAPAPAQHDKAPVGFGWG